MGARLTAFENKSNVEMEIRIFVPPSRPDRYRRIVRIPTGETKQLKTSSLCSDDGNPENPPIFLMVFMGGTYAGVTLLTFHAVKYAKIIGYLDENGLLVLKGRTRFTVFCKLNKFLGKQFNKVLKKIKSLLTIIWENRRVMSISRVEVLL